MATLHHPATGRVDLDQFARRLIQDALATATAAHWEARAETFEAARPKASDHHGKATRPTLAARDARLAQVAQACRNAAVVAAWLEDVSA